MPEREPYAWLAWLGEKDAHVLLLNLMQSIEQDLDLPTLQSMVANWRRNALRALEADDWQAQVDKYLEVRVDARLVTLTRPYEDEDLGSDTAGREGGR